MSPFRTERAAAPVVTRIDFSRDTLGQLRRAAVGMGMEPDEVERMSRARLKASVQALHAAECRREARARSMHA